MEINTGDLSKTIKGLGGQAQIRLFNNLSRKAANALKDILDDLVFARHLTSPGHIGRCLKLTIAKYVSTDIFGTGLERLSK